MTKLALGTAQFGLHYGVTNKSGQVHSEEATKILQFAQSISIDTLDTAIAYGDSESLLGSLGVAKFNLITKLPSIPNDLDDVFAWVEVNITQSLQRLKTSSLYALLLHNPRDLYSRQGHDLVKALENLKSRGLINKLGVSIYDPSELQQITNSMELELVQCPLNVVDRRLEISGWLNRLNSMNVEVHTRSTFLQGLLLAARDEIPPKFERWANLWDSWQDHSGDDQFSRAVACLRYPLTLSSVHRVVVGVDNVAHLREIYDASLRCGCITSDFFPSDSWDISLLINPSCWPSS